MRAWLDLLRFQHRDRAVTKEIVQLRDRPLDGVVPSRILPEGRFARTPKEERVENDFFVLVKQQVLMKRAVLGQDLIEHEVECGFSLGDIMETQIARR